MVWEWEMLFLHRLIPRCGVQHKAHFSNSFSWCYCLLHCRQWGTGQPNSNPVFWGKVVVVARVRWPVRKPPLMWPSHCPLEIHTEKVL